MEGPREEAQRRLPQGTLARVSASETESWGVGRGQEPGRGGEVEVVAEEELLEEGTGLVGGDEGECGHGAGREGVGLRQTDRCKRRTKEAPRCIIGLGFVAQPTSKTKRDAGESSSDEESLPGEMQSTSTHCRDPSRMPPGCPPSRRARFDSRPAPRHRKRPHPSRRAAPRDGKDTLPRARKRSITGDKKGRRTYVEGVRHHATLSIRIFV